MGKGKKGKREAVIALSESTRSVGRGGFPRRAWEPEERGKGEDIGAGCLCGRSGVQGRGMGVSGE
jgi:hypothetical protein